MDYSEFFAIGDDYGGVTIICRRCRRKTRSSLHPVMAQIGYEDKPDVATIINICTEHVHDSEG